LLLTYLLVVILLISQLDHPHRLLLMLGDTQSHRFVGGLGDRHPAAEVLMGAAISSLSGRHAVATTFHSLGSGTIRWALAPCRAARTAIASD
jgi:hypothetical protein